MQPLNVQKHVSDIKNVALTEQPLAGIDLETFVVESWRRCLSDYSIDPEKNPEIHILNSSTLRQHTEEIEQVINIAATEMEHLYTSINGSGYSIILTSSKGIILRSIYDPGMQKDYEHAGLRIGGNWGESHAGTNGIGTCIVECRPVTVHLNEHFVARHTNLTCSAAPIFNPRGELIAILDSSSVSIPSHRSSQALVRGLVSNSARIIENQLLLLSCREQTVLRLHTRAEYLGLPHEALLCLDGSALITAANSSAAAMLNQQTVSDLIDRPLADFISESKIDAASVKPLTPFPGTRLYERLRREGRLLDDHYWLEDPYPLFTFQPKKLSLQELAEATLAFLDVYNPLNSTGYFMRSYRLTKSMRASFLAFLVNISDNHTYRKYIKRHRQALARRFGIEQWRRHQTSRKEMAVPFRK